MSRFVFIAPHAALLAAAVGCAPADAPAPVEAAPVASTDKSMAWTAADDPSLFGGDMVYVLADLPREGEARRVPWAGNYWPTWQDGYNHRWQGAGSQSTMEKYAAAFGVEGLPDAASERFGIDGQSDRTKCVADDECDDKIGEKCARREGAEHGYCVPTWFGVCHAWAPAAVLFDEPREPVERNGVTFAVNDLKALATLLAEDVDVKFVSKRCDDDDQADKISYDESGRPRSGECIDTNPATWHLLLSNVIGRRGESFVEDRTFDDEVWNQPLRGYRVVEMAEVDAAEANRLVGVPPVGGTDVTETGRVEQGEWRAFGPIALEKGQRLSVTLSGREGDIDLYARFGRAPTANTYDCRPYREGSNETCEIVAETAGEVFVALDGYAAGDFTLRMAGGGEMPADYRFNRAARRFYAVTTDVDFIAESPASQDGPLASTIDRYTHTDRYTYVLELDDRGRLIGGEWTGESKRNHPDFVWLPQQLQVAEVMGGLMDRDEILAMLAESVGDAAPAAERRVVEESGALAAGAWAHFGPFEVAAGGSLTAALAGTGDLDLYVRRGARPTADTYDCRPYAEDSDERCTVEGEGPVYVSVNAYVAGDFTLTVTHDAAADAGPAFEGVDVQKSVGQGDWLRLTVEVGEGQTIEAETTAGADVDLYLRLDRAPTEGTYDARAYTDSGNERLTYTAPRAGTLHVAVHGYEAADVRLVVREVR